MSNIHVSRIVKKQCVFRKSLCRHEKINTRSMASMMSTSELQACMTEESKHAETYLMQQSDLRRQLQNEMAARVPDQEASAPWHGPGNYLYQRRRGPGQNYWQLLRWQEPSAMSQGPDKTSGCNAQMRQQQQSSTTVQSTGPGRPSIIFDENIEAGQQNYFHVSSCIVSPDGQWLAYTVDTTGDELYSLYVRHIPQTHCLTADACQQNSQDMPAAAAAAVTGDASGTAAVDSSTDMCLASRCCGPELVWSRHTCSVAVTLLTSDTHVADKVMLYQILDSHSPTSTCLLSIDNARDMSWMGPVADDQYLAVRLSWDGGQEIQLLPLHYTPSSSTQQTVQPIVAVPWQDAWHVMRVAVAQGGIMLLLVDTDDWPDGQIVAVALPIHANMNATNLLSSSRPASVEPTALPETHQDIQQAPMSHVVVVPGRVGCELRQLELVDNQYVTVTRVERMITHVDIHRLPWATGSTQHQANEQSMLLLANLQLWWTWSPCTSSAAVTIESQQCKGVQNLNEAECSQHESGYVTSQIDCEACLTVCYSQLTTPETTVKLHLLSRSAHVFHVEDVGGPAVTSEDYACDLIWVPSSHDNVVVPVTIAYKRSLVNHDGCNPCIVHVYGAYGAKLSAAFNPLDLPLLDRGIIIALAHVRGGGELGCCWHKAGRLQHKHNSFKDLEAVARCLCEHKWTSVNRLAVWGRSAGGLTAAATIAAAPSLFKAAILDVPFLDPLTPMCDPQLPLTRKERREWGDPLNSQADAELIESYSPYHTLPAAMANAWQWHQQRQDQGRLQPLTQNTGQPHTPGQHRPLEPPDSNHWWPDMLITASLNDVRVPAWIPARYVQRLRSLLACHIKTSTSHTRGGAADGIAGDVAIESTSACAGSKPTEIEPVVLLLSDMSAGHFGTSDARSKLYDRAVKYSFLLTAFDTRS